MSTFKIGDKVVIDPAARLNVEGQGNIHFGKVLEALGPLTFQGINEMTGNGSFKETNNTADMGRFKLYVDPTKLKVGDKVRLVTNGGFGRLCKAGDIMTVLYAGYGNGAVDLDHPEVGGGLHFFANEFERIPQEAPVATPALVEVAEEPRQDYIIVDSEGDYIDVLRNSTLAEAKAELVESYGESSYWPYSLFTKAVTLNLSKNLVEV